MKEQSRHSLLLDEIFEAKPSYATKSNIWWTVYYEDEMFANTSMDHIRNNLKYNKK